MPCYITISGFGHFSRFCFCLDVHTLILLPYFIKNHEEFWAVFQIIVIICLYFDMHVSQGVVFLAFFLLRTCLCFDVHVSQEVVWGIYSNYDMSLLWYAYITRSSFGAWLYVFAWCEVVLDVLWKDYCVHVFDFMYSYIPHHNIWINVCNRFIKAPSTTNQVTHLWGNEEYLHASYQILGICKRPYVLICVGLWQAVFCEPRWCDCQKCKLYDRNFFPIA